MLNTSTGKYLSYYKLNEITKFSELSSVNELSRIRSISLWSTIKKSSEKSKTDFYAKSLITFLLLYLLTGKSPSLILSSSDSDNIIIKVNLYRKDLIVFLDKFLLTCNSKNLQKIFSRNKIFKNRFRTSITDLSLLTEIESIIGSFQSLDKIYLDIGFSGKEEFLTVNLLQSLWDSTFTLYSKK